MCKIKPLQHIVLWYGREWGSADSQGAIQGQIWWVRWGKASKLSSEKGVAVNQVYVEGNGENFKLERAWHMWATDNDPFQWFQQYHSSLFAKCLAQYLTHVDMKYMGFRWKITKEYRIAGRREGIRKEGRKEGKSFPHHLLDACQLFCFFFSFLVVKTYLCNIPPHIHKFKSVPLFFFFASVVFVNINTAWDF